MVKYSACDMFYSFDIMLFEDTFVTLIEWKAQSVLWSALFCFDIDAGRLKSVSIWLQNTSGVLYTSVFFIHLLVWLKVKYIVGSLRYVIPQICKAFTRCANTLTRLYLTSHQSHSTVDISKLQWWILFSLVCIAGFKVSAVPQENQTLITFYLLYF